MAKQYTHIKKAERLELAILLDKKYSLRNIAKTLKRSVSSLSDETRNNSVQGVYDPHKANQKARTKRTYAKYQGKKINENKDLQDYIIAKLKRHWNPDEISGRIKEDGEPFYASKTAIYDWLYSVWGQRYCKYLYAQRYTKRKRGPKKTARRLIPNRISLEKRPITVASRQECGHTETDTIVSGKKGSGALTVLLERASRYLDATKLTSLRPRENAQALRRLMLERKVLSTTLDNGIENRDHESLPVPAYFCDPYSSWQRGSVENVNKMIRRYVPKGTNLSLVPEEKIQRIIAIINNKPRKILNYKTAAEAAVETGYIKPLSITSVRLRG